MFISFSLAASAIIAAAAAAAAVSGGVAFVVAPNENFV